MSLLIKYLLKTPNKRRLNSHQVNGFTMVELLIATVMSFLIITPILAFAVNILEGDVKEEAKASAELELQSAIDYIQQDISQAYYIYDGAGVGKIQAQLLPITSGTPVLVFWKRELVANAIDMTATPNTVCGDELDTNGKCDDTYVDSLVAYYLVKDNAPKWCQPGNGSCPARIERWSIRDGVKNASGVYLCGTTGQDTATCPDNNYKAKFRKDKGFNAYNYKSPTSTSTDSYPLTWQNSGYDATTPKSQVLVNYISSQSLDIPANFCINALNIPSSPTPTDATYRIGVDANNAEKFTGFSGCVDSTKNIAQITIRGDALRRNDANNKPCDKESPNCPSVSSQIGGMSQFGQ